ncbi:MAG: tetratricopeptide repeat protein [Methylocystis sp.]
MIEQAMYLTLGFLIAGLFFLSILPLLQRRAARLTRGRLESRMPFSFEQIDAQHSMLLARCAARERRLEQELDSVKFARTRAMIDSGRRLFQAQALEERLDASSRNVSRLESEVAERGQELAETSTRLEAAMTELEALRLQKSALAREVENLCARLDVYESRHAAEPDAGALARKDAELEGAERAIPATVGGWDDWADQASLDPLVPGEAFAFLRGHAGARDEAGAAELIDVLDSTPLTLELAAAQCRRMRTPFSAYAANARLLISSAPRRQDRSAALAAAFGLSLGAARSLSSTAEQLVAFLGLCARERAPLLLVEGVNRDPAETRLAIHILADLALAQSAPFADGVPALLMRQAIHELARERAQQTADGEAVAESLVRRLAEIYPADAFGNPESRSLCAKLTPHLVEICAGNRARTEFNEARADLQVRAGDYLLVDGDQAGAEALFASALSIRESLFGPSHPETAASLDNLATARCARGDFAGARVLLERSRNIFETSFGLDYPATGRRQTECATVLLKLGLAREALALAEGALARLKAGGRARHPWTIEAAFVAADALEALGKWKKAAALREEFCGAAVLSEPAHAGGFAEHLLERLHGLGLVWGKGFAARNHH